MLTSKIVALKKWSPSVIWQTNSQLFTSSSHKDLGFWFQKLALVMTSLKNKEINGMQDKNKEWGRMEE